MDGGDQGWLRWVTGDGFSCKTVAYLQRQACRVPPKEGERCPWEYPLFNSNMNPGVSILPKFIEADGRALECYFALEAHRPLKFLVQDGAKELPQFRAEQGLQTAGKNCTSLSTRRNIFARLAVYSGGSCCGFFF